MSTAESTETGASGAGVRVVIAEDEAIIRLDLKEIREEEGYEVVGETGRGDEAVELVRQHHPDLAILDIKMPGMDGLTAAKAISSERLAAVLILTAFSQRDLIDQARDAGALAYMVKPFQKSELLPAIEIALGRYQEMKALAQEVKSLEEQLETRRLVERAKGLLMDERDMKEVDAFNWIQKSAMRERVTMREIARRIINDGLRPEASAS
jgi:two-component system, response regulator PdtaR